MSQDPFRLFTQQLQRAANRGAGGMPRGGGGIFAGSGLLIALVAGGFALNASLFNGMRNNGLHLYYIFNLFFTVDGGHRAIKYTRFTCCLHFQNVKVDSLV